MNDRSDTSLPTRQQAPPTRPLAPPVRRASPSVPGRLLAKLPRRLRVIVPGTVCMVAVAVLACLALALRLMIVAPELFIVAGDVLVGPFAGMREHPGDNAWLVIAFLNTAALLAHPVWPNRGTAAITIVAMAAWLFWGAAVAFSGV